MQLGSLQQGKVSCSSAGKRVAHIQGHKGALPKRTPCLRRFPVTAVYTPARSPSPRLPNESITSIPTAPSTDNIFSAFERIIQNTFNSQAPGHRTDWIELDGGAWALYPPNGQAPEAIVHFLGAAFVGAAPQLSYRLFLEALSNRNILVIATPYSTGFDHLRVADEAQYKFDRAMTALGPDVSLLPVFGVGHSLGAVLHLLISSRYTVVRAGNAFLSYNNRHAGEVIPFLSPIIAPSARLLGPLLTQMAASPIRANVEAVLDAARSVSPRLLRSLAPLLEQLPGLYLEVAQGREEWNPAPEETRNLVRTYYSTPRNLLLRFKSDSLDDTHALVGLLQASPALSTSSAARGGALVDLTVRALPGDHMRPLQQALVDLPPDVARLANRAVYAGGEWIGRMAGVADQVGLPAASAPLQELSRGVSNWAGAFGGEVGGPLTDGMQALADEIAAWIGTGEAVISGGRALPAHSVYNDRPQFGATHPHGAGSVPRSPSRSPSPAAF